MVDFNVPNLLDTECKWKSLYHRLIQVISLRLSCTVLDGKETRVMDFWMVIKDFAKDIEAYHKDERIIVLVDTIE